MNHLLLALIVFSAQLFIVIGAAVLAEAVGRVTDPRLRFKYWRAIGLVCLALPLSAIIGPEASGSGSGVTGFGVTFLAVSLKGAGAVPVSPVLSAAGNIVWWLLCAGALARFGWLCAGAVRLRRLRKRSRAADLTLTPDLETIRSEVAPGAGIRVSCDIAQPVSFGLRHPIVLLPERFFTMDAAAQRTVVCHELLHVARLDWPWIVVEEAARTLFWFHPAVWWLVERIQESREQLVDRLVIARIPSKRAYMTALLAFADGGRRVETLATAFLRKRHLRSRLRTLAKEPVMSRRRLVGTAVVLMCVMSGAIAGAVRALPLDWPAAGAAADAQEQKQEIVNGGAAGVTLPKVTHKVNPQYTPEALKARIQGSMQTAVVVGTDGRPSDVRVTKSLDTQYGLDDQAVAALKEWRFEPGQKDGKPVAVRLEIEVRFSLKP